MSYGVNAHFLSKSALFVFTLLTACLFSQQAHADYAAVATGKPYLAIFDLTKNSLAATIETGEATRSVALNQTGQTAYTAAGTKLIAIQVSTRKTLASLNFYEQIQSVKVDQTGNKVIVLTRGKTSRIWILTTSPLKVIRQINLKEKTQFTLTPKFAINPSGTQAAIIMQKQNQLKLIDLTAQKKTSRIQTVFLPTKKQKPTKKNRKRKKKVHGQPLINVISISFESNSTLWATTRMKRPALTAINAVKKNPIFSIPIPAANSGNITIDSPKSVALLGSNSRLTPPLLVDLKKRSVQKLTTGNGAFINDFSFDGYYSYLLNPQQRQITIVSRQKNIQTEIIPLPKDWGPTDIEIQHTPLSQTGTPQDDVLVGSRYPNTISGLDGNDTIDGFLGADTLDGGPGDDTIRGGTEPDTLIGGDGNDQLYEEDGNGKMLGGPGDDTIDGGPGGDAIDGEDGNDSIDGGEHDDTIYGGTGNDRIVEKGLGNEPLIDGGPGDDYIDGGLGNDYNMLGSEGNDTLFGRSGNETIDGGPGEDTIEGGSGFDTLYGQDGADLIRGSQNDDKIAGGFGDDVLNGGSGNDLLAGDDGNDTVIGGTGTDTIDTGAGNDTIRVADQSTPDTVNCGPGNDLVYTENTPDNQDQLTNCEQVIKINPEPSNDEPIQQAGNMGLDGPDRIVGTPENEILLGGDGNDQMFGNEGDDYVDGENDDDEVYGGPGNDTVQGRYGNDKVDGGDGNDYVVGGYGKDAVFGGSGDDTLSPGPDQDTVDGGDGNDQTMAVDKAKDIITCGPGVDIVFADLVDQVDPTSCEAARY